ncbi:hypothetical protein BGZ88_001309 [Linnemannia elongata]|nr:hypothetical protein BGZ88_001306 [Linnemannia elongata]KAF9277188.1 hypothetical protein BGZ88_001309 [Linnemannia elongata]
MSKNLNDLLQEGIIPVEIGAGRAEIPSPVSVGTAPHPTEPSSAQKARNVEQQEPRQTLIPIQHTKQQEPPQTL